MDDGELTGIEVADGGECRRFVGELHFHRAGERAEGGQRLGRAEDIDETLADDAAACSGAATIVTPSGFVTATCCSPATITPSALVTRRDRPGERSHDGLRDVEFRLQAAVEIGSATARAVDALGQDVGAGFEMLDRARRSPGGDGREPARTRRRRW